MRRVPSRVISSFPYVVVGWGITTAASPYVAKIVGEGIAVRSEVEFVDHVIPGLLVALAGALLYLVRGRGVATIERLAASAVFAAGFWTLATHWKLILAATDGQQSYIGTLLMVVPGLVLCLVGGFIYRGRSSPGAPVANSAAHHGQGASGRVLASRAARPTIRREDAKPRPTMDHPRV
jgi:hypothetical protein